MVGFGQDEGAGLIHADTHTPTELAVELEVGRTRRDDRITHSWLRWSALVPRYLHRAFLERRRSYGTLGF